LRAPPASGLRARRLAGAELSHPSISGSQYVGSHEDDEKVRWAKRRRRYQAGTRAWRPGRSVFRGKYHGVAGQLPGGITGFSRPA
jgi:hypothetical protein